MENKGKRPVWDILVRMNGIWRWCRQHTPQRPRLAHGSCGAPRAPRLPRQSAPEPGAAQLWPVLGMRLRMREGRVSGVPWGDGLGKGDLGRRRKKQSRREREPL